MLRPKPKRPSRPIVVRVGNKLFPITDIPKSLWPDTWYDNPYWKGRPDSQRLGTIIRKYSKDSRLQPLNIFDIKFFAQYMVDYAGLVSSMAYLRSDRRDKTFIVQQNSVLMYKLKELFKVAMTADDIQKMVDLCKECGVDPL